MKYVGIKNLINSFEKETFEKIKIRNESKLNHRQLFVSKSAIMILLENNEIPFYEHGWEAEIYEDHIVIKEAGTYQHFVAKVFEAKNGDLFVVCYYNDDTYYDTFLLHVPGYSGDYLTSNMYTNFHETVTFDPDEKLFLKKGE